MPFDKSAGAAAKSGSFADISCAWAKLRLIAVVLAVVLPAAPSYAVQLMYVSATGGGNTCSASLPCQDISDALVIGGAFTAGSHVEVICLDGTSNAEVSNVLGAGNTVIDVDCPKGFTFGLAITAGATNTTLRLRHLEFKGGGPANSAFQVSGSGTMILEDCVFADFPAAAFDIEPNGSLNLVINNSRISSNGAGILLKPAAGGSINATLDRVTIADNSGGGIKIDTTNGPVTIDITDSVVSKNAGNGINAVAAANQGIVSIKNSVIGGNDTAGVQANGANAGVLAQTTLFDQNVAGATSVVGGGHISTYGNNSVVGSIGSGFTGSAPLQ